MSEGSTWTVRHMQPETREAIRQLARARGWTTAEALTHMTDFVLAAQKMELPLMKRFGLEYVQR